MLERENTELKAGSEMISQETHAQLLNEMRTSHEEEMSQAVAKVSPDRVKRTHLKNLGKYSGPRLIRPQNMRKNFAQLNGKFWTLINSASKYVEKLFPIK